MVNTLEISKNGIYQHRTLRLILIYLYKKQKDYATKILKGTGLTGSGMTANINKAKVYGLIKIVKGDDKKEKIKVYYQLTDKGRKVTEILIKVDEILDE